MAGPLEQAGFKNAIFARDAPTKEEDPDWDPGDLRYSVIRWAPGPRENALGPNVVDPRSGEVISSHTLVWHDVLRLVELWYFTQVAPLDPRAKKLPLPDDLEGELLRYVVGTRDRARAGAAAQLQGSLGLFGAAAAQPGIHREVRQLGLDYGLLAVQLRGPARRQRLPVADRRRLRLFRHRLGLPGHPRRQELRRPNGRSSIASPRARSTIRRCASAARTTRPRSTPDGEHPGPGQRPDRCHRHGAAQHRPGRRPC